MRRSFLGLVVATALLFVASSAGLAYQLATDDDDKVAGRPSSTTSTTRTAEEEDEEEGVESDEAASEVTVLDPGAEPRRKLRLRPVAGSTTRTVMESRIALTTSIAGESLPMDPAPGFRAVLVQRVDRVDEDGTAHVELSYTDVEAVGAPGADPELVESMNDTLADLENLKSTARIDARGRVLEMSTDSDEISNPLAARTIESLSSQMQNLSAPFPAEPVGLGARWSFSSEASVMGLKMRSTFQFTLSALDGDAYQLDVTSTSEAPPQTSAFGSFAALFSGARTSIEKFDVRTSGSVGGSLTEPLRSSATESGIGDIGMEVSVDGTTERIDLHLETENRLRPA